MSSSINPEDVASRSFRHSLRGYDPAEVDAYLDSLAEQVRRIQSQYLAARQQLGAVEDGEIESQIDSATTDINEVLHAARIASEQMRDRAAREAASTTRTAEENADEMMSTASKDARDLRQAAWDTSTEMLEQVKAEYARLRQQADRDSLAIVGEAEREAHKKMATSRRDAEAKLRSARLEAEALLVEARAERDEMMEMAERSTEAAQERTRALERRRETLMAELEELRLQREAPPEQPGRGASTTVRVVPSGGETSPPSVAPQISDDDWLDDEDVRIVSAPVQHAPWADGSDTVRLVESPERPEEIIEEVDADEVAGEVARLRADADEAPVEADAEPTPEESDDDDDGPDWSPVPDRRPDRELAKAWSESETSAVEVSDDLGSLFRELRVDAPEEPVPVAERVEAVTAEDEVSEDTPLDELLVPPRYTAFELRDRALLPITNRSLRDVKRQLADVQNIQLEALRSDPANWQPDRADLESRLAQELIVVQREAFVAGHRVGHELMGQPDDVARVDVPEGETAPFISALFDEVVLTVQAGREADHGARDLGTAVSRVYRVWRTDEAERRMRNLAGHAYHRGMLRAYADAKLPSIKLEVHSACDECTAAAKEGLSVADFDAVPVHEECRCTIVPG